MTFEELYKDFDSNVKRMYARTKSVMDAEDIVQDGYERALRYWDTFQGEASDRAKWFTTILNNAYKNWCNDDRMKGMTVEYDEMLDTPVPMVDDDTYEIFERAMMAKSTLERQVLYLYFKCGLTPREIVQVVDAAPSTVRNTISNLRKELREEFDHES